MTENVLKLCRIAIQRGKCNGTSKKMDIEPFVRTAVNSLCSATHLFIYPEKTTVSVIITDIRIHANTT